MPYTELKQRNQRKYFYRVISLREGNKINKKRIYLGVNLSKEALSSKEKSADRDFKLSRINKTLEPIKEKIIPLLKKNNVKKAGIFGSFSRGEQKKHSDIDILIEPPNGMGLSFVTLAINLEKSIKRKVDLATYKGINHLLRKKILAEEMRLYG